MNYSVVQSIHKSPAKPSRPDPQGRPFNKLPLARKGTYCSKMMHSKPYEMIAAKVVGRVIHIGKVTVFRGKRNDSFIHKWGNYLSERSMEKIA